MDYHSPYKETIEKDKKQDYVSNNNNEQLEKEEFASYPHCISKREYWSREVQRKKEQITLKHNLIIVFTIIETNMIIQYQYSI